MSSSHPQKGLSLISLAVSLPSDLAKAVAAQRGEWDTEVTIAGEQLADVSRFKSLAAEIAEDGFEHLVLLGKGNQSLCPQVFGAAFGKQPNAPQLLVLDSTDPAQILALRAKIDPARTLFCVSSKSGTTLETNLYLQYFFEETRRMVGDERAGHHFIAVTDPGSKLEGMAQDLDFRRVYHGVPSIDERYSALTDFGLIPFAGMGLDTEKLLKRAQLMAEAADPGVSLGLILGTAATEFGRDKVTLICSPTLRELGAGLEQLLAGCGLIAVDGEAVLAAEHYGKDRIFVYVCYAADDDQNEPAVAALEKAGQPVVRLVLKDLYDLGQAFILWPTAAAIAGSKIMPEVPDVEANNTAPIGRPVLEHDGIQLFADPSLGTATTIGGLIRKHLDRIKPGDYFGLLAYLPMFPEHEAALQDIRTKILEAKQVATVLGFGPRSLHSGGVFLQITCEDSDDLAVPGENYTFGEVKARRARGDFQALAERERRVLRVHLGKDVSAGLRRLRDLVCAAVAH